RSLLCASCSSSTRHIRTASALLNRLPGESRPILPSSIARLTSRRRSSSRGLFFIASILAHASSYVSLCSLRTSAALRSDSPLLLPRFCSAGLRIFNVNFGSFSVKLSAPIDFTYVVPSVVFEMLLRMIRPFLEAVHIEIIAVDIFVEQSNSARDYRAAIGAVFRGNAIRHRYLLAVRRMRLVSYRLTPCDYILDLACAH